MIRSSKTRKTPRRPNATKHGGYSREVLAMRRFLQEWGRWLRTAENADKRKKLRRKVGG